MDFIVKVTTEVFKFFLFFVVSFNLLISQFFPTKPSEQFKFVRNVSVVGVVVVLVVKVSLFIAETFSFLFV